MISRPEHEIAYQEIVALVRRHADKVSALEMLAIAANVVGKLVAVQDQRTTTSSKAMEIVARNLEIGNEQALQEISNSKGRA